MLCDVACRNHTADIIFHNSCSSSHFIGCTTILDLCMSCKQHRLAFNSPPPPWTYNKVPGSHASASALFICSTKSGILLYRWQKRLVQILYTWSQQAATDNHACACWYYKFNKSSALLVKSVQMAVIPTVLLSLLL